MNSNVSAGNLVSTLCIVAGDATGGCVNLCRQACLFSISGGKHVLHFLSRRSNCERRLSCSRAVTSHKWRLMEDSFGKLKVGLVSAMFIMRSTYRGTSPISSLSSSISLPYSKSSLNKYIFMSAFRKAAFAHASP